MTTQTQYLCQRYLLSPHRFRWLRPFEKSHVFGSRRTALVRDQAFWLARQSHLLLVAALVVGIIASCCLPTIASGQQIGPGSQPKAGCGCESNDSESSVATISHHHDHVESADQSASLTNVSLFPPPEVKSEQPPQKVGVGADSDADELEYTKNGLRFRKVVSGSAQAKPATGQQDDQQGSQRRSGTRQIGVPGGGGGGGGGVSDPCQGHITRVVGVTATGETTVKVDYELGENYPTANCPYDNPHYVVFRRIDSRPGVVPTAC